MYHVHTTHTPAVPSADKVRAITEMLIHGIIDKAEARKMLGLDKCCCWSCPTPTYWTTTSTGTSGTMFTNGTTTSQSS